MLFSFALIFLSGIILGSIFNRLKLPQLIGMLLTGIILGPYLLNLLNPKILSISADLRQIALIIILTRAGLNLDINDLKKVGRPAVLMCFLPATLEILGMIIFAPKFLGLGLLDSAILGTVIAAVSPAVIVPKMLKLMEEGYGADRSIPQMIMAGASVDDVFVIVLFTSFIGLASNGTFSMLNLIKIPTSILFAISIGFLCAILLIYLFKKIHMRDSLKVIIILNISFLLVTFEHSLTGIIGFSGLLAIMSIGTGIQAKNTILSKRLSVKYSKLWIAAEVMLFVLVGATVNIKYALRASIPAILLIITVLIFRMAGVFLCLVGTSLSYRERLFCMIAYCPKATVQAAIGSIPLSMGLPSGNIILTVAVLSILITAPLGAFAIDISYKKLLKKE